MIANIHGNAIPGSMELTKAALKHWQAQKADTMWGYVDFAGLEKADILSILAAEKRGEAVTSMNRFGDIAAYKLRVA